jgi:hypothetical protein
MQTISVGAGTTNIHGGAFTSLYSLKEFYIDAENPAYEVVNGCIIDKRNNMLVSPCYGRAGGDVCEVPFFCTSYADCVFKDEYDLPIVTLPKNMTHNGMDDEFSDEGFAVYSDIERIIIADCNSYDHAKSSTTCNSLMEDPNFGQYMAFVIPMGILMILVYVLIGRLVLRVDVSMIKNMPDDFFGEKAKLTSDQKKALGYLVGITLMLLSTTILPKTWAITTVLNKITMFGQAAIVILVLMTIKKEDGTPFFNYAACASKGMSWEGLWMTAFILPIAQYMTAAETGIAAGLRILLAPLSGLSPVMFVVVFMLFAAIITNFANNITLAVVMLPVGITFSI